MRDILPQLPDERMALIEVAMHMMAVRWRVGLLCRTMQYEPGHPVDQVNGYLDEALGILAAAMAGRYVGEGDGLPPYAEVIEVLSEMNTAERAWLAEMEAEFGEPIKLIDDTDPPEAA